MKQFIIVFIVMALYCHLLPSQQAYGQVGVVAGVAATATVGAVIEKMEERVNKSIQSTLGGASIVANTLSRNLLLVVQAAKQEFSQELDKRFDQIELTRSRMLSDVSAQIDKVGASIDKVGKLKESTVLDIEDFMDKIPLLRKNYAIKRIEGAAQAHRRDGFYHIKIISNALDFSGKAVGFTMGGKGVPQDWISQSAQYTVDIDIPAAELDSYFEEDTLNSVDLIMSFEVPDRSWWQIWLLGRTRTAKFVAKINLFPIYPVIYSLTAMSVRPTIDKTKTEWVQSYGYDVPGCGNSGCNHYHNVFADVPIGGLPTGTVTNCQDSFVDFGSFIGPNGEENYCNASDAEVSAIEIGQTSVRMVYKQHSHNQTRRVSFRAGYHPPAKQDVKTTLTLKPIAGSDFPPGFRQRKNEIELQPSDGIVLKGRFFDANLKLSEKEMSPAEKEADKTAREELKNMSVRIRKYTISSSLRQGFLQFGKTYEARLPNDTAAYTLVVRYFDGGDELVATELQSPNANLISVTATTLTQFKRIVVTPKAPW